MPMGLPERGLSTAVLMPGKSKGPGDVITNNKGGTFLSRYIPLSKDLG